MKQFAPKDKQPIKLTDFKLDQLEYIPVDVEGEVKDRE